tara:strand:- start:394 stop:879 length:486 start_codon:yes stop_codon:yes gene_type:complete
MGASRKIMKAAVGGSSTPAQGGFSPIDLLQQQQAGKFPENTTQKPSFTGSGAKSLPSTLGRGLMSFGAAGGSALPKAVGMITGRGGRATFSGDSFSGMGKKEKKGSEEDQYRTFRVSKDLDYEATKKRLLELAKEESIKINKAKEADKMVYDRSLPTMGDN